MLMVESLLICAPFANENVDADTHLDAEDIVSRAGELRVLPYIAAEVEAEVGESLHPAAVDLAHLVDDESHREGADSIATKRTGAA